MCNKSMLRDAVPSATRHGGQHGDFVGVGYGIIGSSLVAVNPDATLRQKFDEVGAIPIAGRGEHFGHGSPGQLVTPGASGDPN